MKTRILIIITILIGLTFKVKADSFSYSDSLRIQVETKNYIVIHFHDWTNKTKDSRYKMISTNQDPFTQENDYSYLECIDKKSGKSIFKKPCPALTKIQISDDEKHIIGISKIMLWNPFQLVIFDVKGGLIKKRHISSEEAKLDSNSFMEFKQKYSTQYYYLDSINRIYRLDKPIYVDFISMSMPRILGDAWKYLYDFIARNHLSDNYSETVTN
ncbi:MAG: hypothetical protein B6D64_12055, partial [Bacteroidetes bacterium 4484_276]